ncbi:MAG: S8 family serine peptidase, partial [Clostridia bacterium]|nr:S8 family serine peptidase [Clostridia bacterium]
MGVTAEVESVDVSGNPAHGKQNDTFKTHHIKEGWDYLKKNGYNPGGSSDVVVAVIDTGVDYTHLDLRNNIWVNSAEIPENGKDDDGNGYIDDLCGWDCVGNDKDPMDDNGHGTHVAGIIAAEDNKEGGVGVAYGCKIMVLKAGNSS